MFGQLSKKQPYQLHINHYLYLNREPKVTCNIVIQLVPSVRPKAHPVMFEPTFLRLSCIALTLRVTLPKNYAKNWWTCKKWHFTLNLSMASIMDPCRSDILPRSFNLFQQLSEGYGFLDLVLLKCKKSLEEIIKLLLLEWILAR